MDTKLLLLYRKLALSRSGWLGGIFWAFWANGREDDCDDFPTARYRRREYVCIGM